MPPSALDLDHVRRQFPALASGYAYLDNAGGSQILGRVVDRIADYLTTSNVQLGASYEVSRSAGERVAEGVAAVAALVGAADPSEVVFGSSTTQLLANLAQAMAPSLREGDEIVVTNVDHEANVGCWRRLAARGVVIREWQIDPESFEMDLAALGALLGPRTRLVAMTHCSNVLGTILPVREAARMAHAVGARICVDGVAYAPHRRVDVAAFGVDYYVLSLYKVFGPHQAVLWGKREHLLGLASLNHGFLGEDAIPYKLQPGNLNFELTYGCGGILAYLREIGRAVDPAAEGGAGISAAFDAMAAHEEKLASRLLDYLRDKPGVRIIGKPRPDPTHRVPTVSFVVDGIASSEIPPRVDPDGIGIRFGDFYARRLSDALELGPDGVVRVSMVHYNSLGEVERVIASLEKAIG